MEEQPSETDENCPCKRQRLRQGSELNDTGNQCAFSELWASLDNAEEQENPSLPSRAQGWVPDDAGDRVPGNGFLSMEQIDIATQETEAFAVVSNTSSKTVNTVKESDSWKTLGQDRTGLDMGIQGDFNFNSSIKLLSFGEYDLETGEMAKKQEAGKTFYHVAHSVTEETNDLINVYNSHSKHTGHKLKGLDDGNQAKLASHSAESKSSDGHSVGEDVRAMAENSFIGTYEKTKFTVCDRVPHRAGGSTPAYDRQEKIVPVSASGQDFSIQQRQEEEAVQFNSNQTTIMPPEYLTDSGFIEMFSNGSVCSQNLAISANISTQLEKNSQVKTSKSGFRIKPEYLFNSSVKNAPKGTLLWPDSFSRKRPNELFDIETVSCRESAVSNSINSLPASLLVEIFKNFTPCTLLRTISCVCKYWYNLSRDPDLWRTLNLRNQHKLTDAILEQLLAFSERVLHVNLTDCRFITDRGVKAVLSRCQSIRTLKLMRCFDLTDQAFDGLGARKLCAQLSALHLDGCYKLSDKTVLEVAESCKKLKIMHLNQCNKVTDTGVMALAHNCSKLRQLLLDHCDKVTNTSVMELVQGCPDLVYLNFMSCGVSDDGVRQFAKLRNLTNVDLSNIPRLTPGPVMTIARSCQQLECINISLNAVMNDDCVSYIAEHCRHLKRLYCVSCHITDRGMEGIARHCPTLEALDVGWCQDITDDGVRMISLACKHLTYFGLIRCDKVTVETIEELVLQFPHINYSTFVLESRRLLERARREGFQCTNLPTAPH